jgi:hypothetical protein
VTTAPTDSAARQHDQDKSPSFAIPLIVWMLIQLAAIALAASGAPLSASFPMPPQSLAVHEMLVAQFVGSAMFAAVLFRGGWRGWLAMVLAAAPMLMGAAWLARMPLSRVPGLWVHVGAWLTMLALWSAVGTDSGSTRRAMHSPAFRSMLTAAAMLLSAGGLLLWYLQSEFQPDRDFAPIRFLPLSAVLQSLTSSSTSFATLPLLSTVTLAVVAAVILAANASRRRANARPVGG